MQPSLTEVYQAYIAEHDIFHAHKNYGRGITKFSTGPLRLWLTPLQFDGKYLEQADRDRFQAVFGDIPPQALDKLQQLWSARIHRPRSRELFAVLFSNMTGAPRPHIGINLAEARLTSWPYERIAA